MIQRLALLTALIFGFSFTFAQQVSTVAGPFNGSGGVTLDKEGNIYVGDFGTALNSADGRNVLKITPTGTVTTFGTGLSGASGNDFGPDGNLYQANIAGSRISKITPGGSVSTYVSQGIVGPVGLVFDTTGNMYVCNCQGNSIQLVTPTKNSIQFASGNFFRCPNGITIDEAGNLYVANFSDGRVLRIDPNGQVRVLAIIPGNNNGHLTYSNGRLFVCSHGSASVYVVELDGTVKLFAGNGSRGNTDGGLLAASFSLPNGIAATPTGDTLYLNSSVPTIPQPGTPLNPSMLRRITGVNNALVSIDAQQPLHDFTLSPNPGSNVLKIRYKLDVAAKVDLQVLDASGKIIWENTSGAEARSGSQKFQIDTSQWPQGIYFVSVMSPSFSQTSSWIKK